jgi:hypothetical protein
LAAGAHRDLTVTATWHAGNPDCAEQIFDAIAFGQSAAPSVYSGLVVNLAV